MTTLDLDGPAADRIDGLVRDALRPSADDAARVARRALAAPTPRPHLRLAVASICAVLVAVAALLVAYRSRVTAPPPTPLGGHATLSATESLVTATGPDGVTRVFSTRGTRRSHGVVLIVMKGGTS